MNRFTMTKIAQVLILSSWFLSLHSWALAVEPEQKKAASQPSPAFKIPYERPIGFTLNVGAISSMTFEGRFLLGLLPNLSLVVSPSYQNTPELPLFHPERDQWGLFDIKRLNLGVGIRGHFYEYDSWDGFFIEGMTRAGTTWMGDDKESMWSIIPSLIFGYASVYKSGYTVSFGVGFEWEFLGEAKSPNAEFLKTAYYGISKVPLTGELSLGWTW